LKKALATKNGTEPKLGCVSEMGKDSKLKQKNARGNPNGSIRAAAPPMLGELASCLYCYSASA
jgi:hypothetical protein